MAQGQKEVASQKLTLIHFFVFLKLSGKVVTQLLGTEEEARLSGRGLHVLLRHSYSSDDCVFQGQHQQVSLLIKGATRTFPNK